MQISKSLSSCKLSLNRCRTMFQTRGREVGLREEAPILDLLHRTRREESEET